MKREDDGKRADGVHVREFYGAGALCWMHFLSFLYAGESYDYAFEVAGSNETEQQARDNSRRLQCLIRARRNFLRDSRN